MDPRGLKSHPNPAKNAQVPFPVDVRTIVYCVAEKGNKFIFGEPVESNGSLSVVLNWSAVLKH